MIVDAWRSLRPAARAVVAVVAGVVGLNLLLSAISTVAGGAGPGGPTSSSYATAPHGMAAWADLLGRYGHVVDRRRRALDGGGLDPSATLVVADPSGVSAGEVRAVEGFLEGGGRLVAAGASAAPVVSALLGGHPAWNDASIGTARALVPVAEVDGVGTVAAGGTGAWGDVGGALPVLAGSEGTLAVVAPSGRGRIVALADASPLQNRLLARADNAALGLAVVGAGRPVVFAEAQHGYGAAAGIRAVPSRWRWALAGALLATLAWMWSRGRRLGPADEVSVAGPPPRRAYVDALAAALARTRQPDVVAASLQARARRRLAERSGLTPDAGDDALRRAAVGAGLPAADVAALFGPVAGDADLLALGRALAGLGERHR